MISLATPKQIAGRIASMHNARCCRHCRRPVDGGVFSFGMSGSDPRWFPSIGEAEAAAAGPRLFYPISSQDITRDDVEGWLAEQRDELDQIIEAAWHEREERKRQREQRRPAFPCFVCNRSKELPSSTCFHCGDIPTTHNSDRAETARFDREYGAIA